MRRFDYQPERAYLEYENSEEWHVNIAMSCQMFQKKSFSKFLATLFISFWSSKKFARSYGTFDGALQLSSV